MLNKLGLTAPVLLDGGLGTELQKGSMPPDKSTITQNLENPGLVESVHRSYLEAGAQIIAANTFAGNFTILSKSGLEADEEQYNLEGMKLARQASSGLALVAGDIGPTGEFYHTSFNHDSVKEVFTRQALIMMREPPDFFFIETMFDAREALAALAGIKEVCGEIPVAVSITYNKTVRGYFTMMGDKAAEWTKTLAEAGADAVGANCTLDPEDMIDLVKLMKDTVSIPVIFQPNAGKPEAVDGEIVYKFNPDEFADGLVRLAEAGADIVGGCCGSTPEMIRIARGKLGQMNSPPAER